MHACMHSCTGAHLIQQRWISSPLQQSLHSFAVAILAGQVQWCKPTVIDYIHEEESIQQCLHDVIMAIPRSFVQSSIPKLDQENSQHVT